MSLPQHFDFRSAQAKWNAAWAQSGIFHADADSEREPFVIILPPPNVTGILHVGHVLGDSVQDLLIRWKKMQGCNALYVPGVDHAGIATQKVVEKDLAKRGIKRADLTREKFLEYAWEWKEKHHKHIVSQLKNLGCALDFSREAFTLDEERSHAVREVFVSLYEKGLVYRGYYIVNWCPSCATAISDEEVEYIERDGKLYWIKYPTTDGSELVVATTRPETMLGDTAVAVNPGDKRTKEFVGKTVRLPLTDREIPVVADEAVDPEFGSGFVKVTPAHDPNDFETGRRHDLPHVIVIDRQGVMNDNAGERFAGMDRFEARNAVLEALDKEGLLVKVEPHRHSVGHHDRCNTVIEPLLSQEWFVRMKPLAKPAIAVAESGEIDFYPPRWKNVYLSWMTNIRDWCVSRQLWWGHRIPVWYCQNGHLTVARVDPTSCVECKSTELEQDDNVLDTWFSSWLWTFSPLGWPRKTKDLETFHPTSVLVTGSEIIFFWVARMIMASLEFMKEIPFSHVFLTGIVRDTQGRKMSKSLGNSPDPLDIIDRYGTDPFRFTLVMLSPPGHDVFFDEQKLEIGRNFVNKIWQASRMIMGAIENDGDGLTGAASGASDPFTRAWNDSFAEPLAFEPDLQLEDRWILAALDRAAREIDEKLSGSRLNEAASRAYDFFWKDFCDWYIELAKIRIYGEGDRRTVLAVLVYVLGESLKMLHPLMPYVTEELWALLPMSEGMLLEKRYPQARDDLRDEEALVQVGLMQELVTAARNVRSLYHIQPGTTISLRIKHPAGAGDGLAALADGIRRLARVEDLTLGPDVQKEKGDASSPVGAYEIIVPLEGVADIHAELKRLAGEKEKISKELGAVEKKLSNDNFVQKAKSEVVEKAREKRELLRTELRKIEESMSIISEHN